MKLLKRLQYAFKYDYDQDFIVYSIPTQMAMTFLYYEDAKKYVAEQPQYKPKIMIAIRPNRRAE